MRTLFTLRPSLRGTSLVLAFGALSGCAFDEGLLINNLRGTVHIPEEAVTRTIVDDAGNETTISDPRLIGPVILGLYPSVYPENVVERYPHPEVGPQFQEGVSGDAFPYGGTTIGDIRFACFEFLSCKVSSGRFVDYQDLVDWFKLVNQPIVDAAGVEIENGEFIRQTCYDILNVTADDEVRITAYEDRNDDGEIDAKDLDFVYDENAKEYVGDFTIWQQEFFWDKNQEKDKGCTPGLDCDGFSLWGWMDSPSNVSYSYSTCNGQLGLQNQEYNADFFGGAPYSDLLNFPATYITEGDWVAGEGVMWKDLYEQPDIYLDFAVQ